MNTSRPFGVLVTIALFFTTVMSAQDGRGVRPKAVTLGLAGDTMLGRLVDRAIGEKGYSYPWGDMLPILRSTDLNLVNLETTLTHSFRRAPKTFNFRAVPDRVKSLLQARIGVCNLANNHILDFGLEGMKETMTTLQESGIAFVGVGSSIEKARELLTVEVGGIKVGILGCTDNEPTWEADPTRAGTHFVSVLEPEELESRVKKLDEEVDLLVLTIHWGPNMRVEPSLSFVSFAHRMVDAGVDVFHGHSAHVPQGIEVYGSGIILYDNGDFVDDYRVEPDLRNDQSFFALVQVDAAGIRSVQLIPTLISNMQVNQAGGKDRREIVDRLRRLSKPFGTDVIEQGGEVWVSWMDRSIPSQKGSRVSRKTKAEAKVGLKVRARPDRIEVRPRRDTSRSRHSQW